MHSKIDGAAQSKALIYVIQLPHPHSCFGKRRSHLDACRCEAFGDMHATWSGDARLIHANLWPVRCALADRPDFGAFDGR